MTGGGLGLTTHVLPELDAVAVITTTNYRVQGEHALSDRLPTTYVLPLLASQSRRFPRSKYSWSQ
jgi:hypothetical protein